MLSPDRWKTVRGTSSEPAKPGSEGKRRRRSPLAPTPNKVRVVTLAQARHHVLDAGVVFEAVHGEVLAVARVLEAAVGHLGHEGDVGVDPDAPEIQPAADPHRPAVVLGEYTGGEAVLDAVGPPYRLVLIGERLHGDDGTEDLRLRSLVVLPEAGD